MMLAVTVIVVVMVVYPAFCVVLLYEPLLALGVYCPDDEPAVGYGLASVDDPANVLLPCIDE